MNRDLEIQRVRHDSQAHRGSGLGATFSNQASLEGMATLRVREYEATCVPKQQADAPAPQDDGLDNVRRLIAQARAGLPKMDLS